MAARKLGELRKAVSHAAWLGLILRQFLGLSKPEIFRRTPLCPGTTGDGNENVA